MGMSQMSEGCPYDCNFCSVWITHGKRIEVASLENIQHDFQSLPSSIWGMFFADDIWMQGTEKQLRSLYDPLLNWLAEDFYRRRPDFALTVETRTDLFLRQKARFADWTRRGKLLRVFFGVEAVTNEALDAYSKRTTVNHNSEAIRQAAELGLSVVAQLVIPLDADRAYFDEIVRFVDAHRPWIRTLNFTVATPLPGTELYQDLLKLHPDLSDRKKVRHPAFSLYTALTPTRLSVPEFYEQVARLFRIATAVDIFKKRNLLSLKNLLFRTPRLIPRVLHSARLIKALSQTETYLQMHRDVQGERLLGGLAA
jgi:magnesium-protoporphyrin IX monomethyl ester (oxidative) cyclase